MHQKPKKSLGQNFLVDQNIQNKIVNSCDLKPTEVILEVGAGRGELTKLLAPRVQRLVAVEIDRSLCRELADIRNATVLNRDILKLDLNKHFRNKKVKIKVIGNIPYYISSPIIEHLLQYRKRILAIFLTVQKEFAQRVVAAPGSKVYGSLSCFVQYYAEPKILFTISKNSFYPAPKVDSAFIQLKVRPKTALSGRKEKLLFRIIRASFNQRRKTLRNSLSGLLDPSKLDSFFKSERVSPDTRPEDLTLKSFIKLACLKNSKK
jgi:16S rRNA (adenine1518-N6/adenine1519-N6)-dimethyltransferase